MTNDQCPMTRSRPCAAHDAAQPDRDQPVVISHWSLVISHWSLIISHSRLRRLRYPLAIFLILLAVLLPWCGCAGYQVGNESLYPTDIQTVYVPVFESNSFRRGLGELLTEAVVKRIEEITPYKVVGSAAAADSVLSGRIMGDTKRVVVQNRFNDPRGDEVALAVQVSWVDRQSNLIRQSDPIPVPLELVAINESATVVPEVGQSIATGQLQTVKKLAAQIVAMMEAPW